MRLYPRWMLGLVSLAAAAAVWLPCVHWFYRPSAEQVVAERGVPPLARRIASYYLHVWTEPALLQAELAKMRSANAEWDFMGRSFFAWALANMALRDPSLRPVALETIDRIVDATLAVEAERGMHAFLMPYGRARPFVQQPARSQFLDGEIALMLALRCLVEDKPPYRAELRRRVEVVVARMEASPTLSAESYPDECWTFCNSVALAAIRVADRLDGTDHSILSRRWIERAGAKLLDADTGLLIAAYALDGRRIYGPEGSTIWLACHCLSLIDEPFARRQYELARQHLAGSLGGFGYAREWPRGRSERMDIDSGLVVPGVGASVASSGLAMVGAATFGDVEYLRRIVTTAEFLGFPVERDGRRKYAASNQVGDAVALYALVAGPAWQRVRRAQP